MKRLKDWWRSYRRRAKFEQELDDHVRVIIACVSPTNRFRGMSSEELINARKLIAKKQRELQERLLAVRANTLALRAERDDWLAQAQQSREKAAKWRRLREERP